MTDTGRGVDAWVPRLGALVDMDVKRAELIRGLYELAAWVADHPEFPLPRVVAQVVPRHGVFADECATVDEVAAELGSTPGLRSGGAHYVVEARFGDVLVSCAARTTEHVAGDHTVVAVAAAGGDLVGIAGVVVAGGSR